jgi:hypothetical protein
MPDKHSWPTCGHSTTVQLERSFLMNAPARLTNGSTATLIVAAVALASLGACTSIPRNVSSLSPTVKADALAYNDAVGDAADGILLDNVLRSEYLEPLNLSQLSSVSGALSLQGTATLTVPFGAGSGGSTSRGIVPAVTASTTPTYTLTPLNTQAFIQSLLQPVSAAYVLNRWQAGISRELLLLLFVKEIDFPKTNSGIPYSFINDPDNDARFSKFKGLVEQLIAQGAELKAIDVLDPVGPKFALKSYVATRSEVDTTAVGPPTPSSAPAATSMPTASSTTTSTTSTSTTTSNSTAAPTSTTTSSSTTTATTSPTSTRTPAPTTTPAKTVTQQITTTKPNEDADSTGFSQITGNSDGQYHFGNVKNDSTGDLSMGQLYRVYAGQIELCVDTKGFNIGGYSDAPNHYTNDQIFATSTEVTPGTAESARKPVTVPLWAEGAALKANLSAQMGGGHAKSPGATPGAQGGTPAAATTPGGRANPAAGPTATSGSPQALTAALLAARTSALVDVTNAKGDEIVLDSSEERDFEADSARFVHIQWRSVSEIFDYLGAVLRYNERLSLSQNSRAALTFTQKPNDTNIVGETANAEGTAITFFQVSHWDSKTTELPATHLITKFHGKDYWIPDIDPSQPIGDDTKVILSMLNTLVDYSSQPGPVSTSTPLRLLPIP